MYEMQKAALEVRIWPALGTGKQNYWVDEECFSMHCKIQTLRANAS